MTRSVGLVSTEGRLSIRQAMACGAATLIAYVGLVHEIVGPTLYPEGPAAFGGAIGWHGAGLSAIAAGVLLGAGTLSRVQVPVVPLASAVGVVGAVVLVVDVLSQCGFHFFAFTLVVASLVLIVTAPGRRRRGSEQASDCLHPLRPGEAS